MLKEFLKYSISSILSMWIFSLYTMVDGIFIGRYVGSQGLAAINILMPYINLIFATGIMTGVGAGTLLGISFGKGEVNKGNKIISTASLFLLFTAFIMTTLIQINIDKVIIFLGASNEIFPYVKEYLSVISLFSICFMLGYSLEVYIKVDGSPMYPTISVITGGVVNILLDYLFVVILSLGMKGAALATGLSQITTTSMLLFYILKKSKKIKFQRFKFKAKILFSLLKTGFPEFLTEIATGLSTLVFNLIIIRRMGEEGLASFGIINYVTILIVLTMIGLNQGMQPLLSYNLGKEDEGKIKECLKIAIITVLITSSIFFILVFFNTKWVVTLFIKDVTNINSSILPLKFYSLGYLILGLNTIISGYFTAMNKPLLSNTIIFLRGFLVLGTMLFFLPKVFGNNGIWLAMPISEGITLIVSIYFLFYKKVIIKDPV